jgi:hypothetical protein
MMPRKTYEMFFEVIPRPTMDASAHCIFQLTYISIRC